jgi:hypothetical protein
MQCRWRDVVGDLGRDSFWRGTDNVENERVQDVAADRVAVCLPWVDSSAACGRS